MISSTRHAWISSSLPNVCRDLWIAWADSLTFFGYFSKLLFNSCPRSQSTTFGQWWFSTRKIKTYTLSSNFFLHSICLVVDLSLDFLHHLGTIQKRDIEALEKVQKKATKILPALRNLSYSERLKICQMTTLHYRRIRGDMIETYKIVTGKYETCVAPSLSKERTYVA